jgi:hypothetical protein
VIKCRDRKLQSRQGDNIEFHLFKPVDPALLVL